MARFLNSPANSHEVFVIRMSDTHDTNVDDLVQDLRIAFPENSFPAGIIDRRSRTRRWTDQDFLAAFPGFGFRTGINDHYSRTGRWPTMEEAIQQNKRVLIFAQDSLCNANCRRKYPFFLPVSTN